MTKESGREQRMFRYLLEADKLPVLEKERFEDEYFSDDETFELLLAAEDELIDRYLRGDLDERQRERFENFFLISPRRRQKVENARTLRQALPQFASSEQSISEPGPARRSNFSGGLDWFHSLKWLQAMSFAMASLLIAIGLASYIRIRQTNKAIEQEKLEQNILERQIADARKENSQLTERLQRANGQLSNLNGGQIESSSNNGASPTIITSFILNLVPGNRNNDNVETLKLSVPSKTDVTRLQVTAPASEYINYNAELKSVGSDVALWRQRKLQARRNKTGEVIIDLWLPASLLAKGDYILELTGITSNGSAESLPPYTFSVMRK